MSNYLQIVFRSTLAGSNIKTAWHQTPHHVNLFATDDLKTFYLQTFETADSTKENLRYLLGNQDAPVITDLSQEKYAELKNRSDTDISIISNQRDR